ncbi:MAG: hypothetical protein ISS15_02800 [Alphaproteobacteria bacterium]|nr:hypothetical protein [Alphaproteobacteria bacterium]MBL7096563.1 hypothetical protein [Alphaproteobacteria bacterium]
MVHGGPATAVAIGLLRSSVVIAALCRIVSGPINAGRFSDTATADLRWRVLLFAFLYRNAVKVVDRFSLPLNRVVEVARQIDV